MSQGNNDFSSSDRSASDPSNTQGFTPTFNQDRNEFGSSRRRGEDTLGSTNLGRDNELSSGLNRSSDIDPSHDFNRGSDLNRGSDFERGSDFSRRGDTDLSGQRADYSASAPDSRGGFGTTGIPGNTTTADTIGSASHEHRGVGLGSSERDRNRESELRESSGKPGVGQRLKGTVDKTVGKVTGNQERVERGEERKAGGFGDNY